MALMDCFSLAGGLGLVLEARMSINGQDIFGDLHAVVEHVTAIRHDLHGHPELGYEERYTAGVVVKELERLGIGYRAGLAGGTGVVGVIDGTAGAGEGRCVALRADMDALPITEATGLVYASQTPGKMHACGHDGHVAVLLGAAAILKEAAPRFRGTVKLLFQPAEEGLCGAERMCNDGVLENPKVDAVFGLHGWPGLKVGMVATRPGPLLASVDGFTITVKGRGGHAAAPQEGIDPIVCGAALVGALQTVVSRETDPTDACVVTVSQFHAGTSFNVIPDKAEINGTIRALTPEKRAAIIDSLERMAQGVAVAYRCTAQIDWFGATPCTNNTPELAELVREVAQETLGAGAFVMAAKPAMWGEDFSFYLQRVPGCFFVLGVQPLERDSYPMLHNPQYDFTDGALRHGIGMMSSLALKFLERAGQ